MTRLKSAYRPKAYRDGGAVMADDIAIKVPTGAADVPDGLESGGVIGDGAIADDASLAFRTQIENLLRAEEASQQRAASAPLPPSSRSQRLDQLRREGLSEAAIGFLAANPEIMDTPQLADQAARAARDEGHQPDTDAFFEAVKSNFRAIAAPASSQALNVATKYSNGTAMPPIAEEAALERHAANRRSAIVSAPVSRDVPSSSREDRVSSRVTLSIAEKEHARLAGVTETAYAQGKLELERRKRAGEI